MDMPLQDLVTEQVNSRSTELDRMTSIQIVQLMNLEDIRVYVAVNEALPQIVKAVDLIVSKWKDGGRLIYVGAGTSGRLGMLDALELPPTFGVPPERVPFVLAGGSEALLDAVEGNEDDEQAGERDLLTLNPQKEDCLIAVSASGRTPYCLAALRKARECGLSCITVACNASSAMSQFADVAIEVVCGPEVLTGSTRLKAGTAQKTVLNMLSTASMIRLGKCFRHFMVDMQPMNRKLRERAKRTVMMAAQVSAEKAEEALEQTGWHGKTAIVTLLTQSTPEEARGLLNKVDGHVHKALAAARKSVEK